VPVEVIVTVDVTAAPLTAVVTLKNPLVPGAGFRNDAATNTAD
jgi:hypothetical protein